MISRSLLSLFSIAILTVMTIPAWANSKSSDSQRVTIELGTTATLNGQTLEPGNYTVVAEGNQAKFEQDGKVVAEAPCSWKTLSSKALNTDVVTNQNRITEIDISGKTQAIEFSS
jgi:hypothetical protein